MGTGPGQCGLEANLAGGLIITQEEVVVWASGAGAVFAFLAVAVPIAFRWWDSRSHLKIKFYVGDDPPREWLIESGIVRKTPPDKVAMYWVENVGARTESLSDACISVPGGGEVHQFTGGNPPMPSPLQTGFRHVWAVDLQGFSRNLVNEGYTGTARVDLVIRLGREDDHTYGVPARFFSRFS